MDLELDDRDKRILAFETAHPHHNGAKESIILRHLDMRAVRYYQLLNAIIEKPAALAYAPRLVKGLLAARGRRLAHRASRTFNAA